MIDSTIGRAASLRSTLREQAPHNEQCRQITAETIDLLDDAGLLLLGTPARHGGQGWEYDNLLRVAFELGRGCGATAWCYALWMVHSLWIGHFPLEAQDEVYAQAGRRGLIASAINPPRGTLTKAGGGVRVTGHWRFSSGCDAARWFLLAVPAPPGQRWVLVPRSDATISDTWFTSGMRGTGSKDISVDDVFVPSQRIMDPDRAGIQDTTGWDAHHQVSYLVPFSCVTGWEIVAPVAGMAQAAVDEFETKLRSANDTMGRRMPLLLARLAESAAEVDAVQLLQAAFFRDVFDAARAGRPCLPLERLRYRRNKNFAAILAVRATNRLFEASGARSLFDDAPMQRIHRDINAAARHQGLDWDTAAIEYGLTLMGESGAEPVKV